MIANHTPDPMAAVHEEMEKRPLAKHWYRIRVDGASVYLNDAWKVAQYEHPGTMLENALRRTSPNAPVHKPPKGQPLIYSCAAFEWRSHMTSSRLGSSRPLRICRRAGRR